MGEKFQVSEILVYWFCIFPERDGLQSTGLRSAPCGRKHQMMSFPRRGYIELYYVADSVTAIGADE